MCCELLTKQTAFASHLIKQWHDLFNVFVVHADIQSRAAVPERPKAYVEQQRTTNFEFPSSTVTSQPV